MNQKLTWRSFTVRVGKPQNCVGPLGRGLFGRHHLGDLGRGFLGHQALRKRVPIMSGFGFVSKLGPT